MGIRLIAVDMDGTLLNENNKITERTIRALVSAESRGILIVPATGRCRALLPEELRHNLRLRYAILENGAEVWDYQEERAVSQCFLPDGIAKRIADAVKNERCFAEFFRNGDAYAEIACLELLDEVQTEENFTEYFKRNHIFVRSLEKLPEVLKETKKINLYHLNADVRSELEIWLRGEGSLALTTSVFGNLEMQNKEANKGNALKILCGKLGIATEETAAFGDGDNDLEMLRYAGVGVAMENAAEKIKCAADETTLSNTEEGVAVYLEEMLRKETGGKQNENIYL